VFCQSPKGAFEGYLVIGATTTGMAEGEI